MSVIKMCVAVGQNVCLVCVVLTVLHSGGEAKSKRFEDPLSNTRSELASLKGRQLVGKYGPKSSASMEHRSNVTQEVLEGAISEHSRFFMKKLFQKYGSNGLMTFEGFEHFLENLGLAEINIVDHTLADHQEAGQFINLHNGDHQHQKSQSSPSTIPDSKEVQHSNRDHHDHDHDYDSHAEDFHRHKTQDHRKRKERDLTDGKEELISDKVDSAYREKRKIHLQSVKHVSDKSSRLNSRHIRGIEEAGHDHGSHEGHDHGSHEGHDHGYVDDHDHGSHHDHLSHTDHGSHGDHASESKHSNHDHEHDAHTEITTVPTLSSTRAKNSRKPSRKRGRIQISNRRNRKTTETPIVAGTSLSPAVHSKTLDSKLGLPCHDGALSCQKKCLSAQELLVMFNLGPDSEIEETQFLQLCPVLMYQLDAGTCGRMGTKSQLRTHSPAGVPHADHDHDHDHDHDNVSVVEAVSGKSIPGKVWGFSLLAVIIISAVGLVSVAIIPIINKVFYNHLLQFLVAVAVGALSGDALLHLIPHAMELGSGSGGHESHGHEDAHEDAHGHDSQAVWIGLMALSGIYGFFILERVVTIITVVKNKKKRQKKRSSPVYMDKEAQFSPAVGAKLSGHVESCEGMVMVVHPNKAIREFANGTQAAHHECEEEHHANGKEDFEEAMESLTTGVIVEQDHSHGHGHGHSHEIPNSVAAVAWMVILGDGIHNFTDGLAIGAAFSSSVTGGISTSIAIFCHELPHEIGDFAVLLRTGMSIKQALVYNCVSSVLCLVGMVIGVPLGNLDNASIWIFAMVGGMFIYIAFVDMLPEMTSVDTKQGEHPFLHLIFQVFGMLVGAGIMLLIAVYEHDIMSSLGS